MPTRYDELIRDCIHEIMDEAGVQNKVATLRIASFEQALRAKLAEESWEAAAAVTPDDLAKGLADQLEVAAALMDPAGLDDAGSGSVAPAVPYRSDPSLATAPAARSRSSTNATCELDRDAHLVHGS